MTINTDLQLRWSDMDMLGHVYNGNYQHLFDVGKSDYFERVLHLEHNWIHTGDGFLTATTTNTYLKSVTLGLKVHCTTCVEKVGTKSFTFFQQIIATQTSEVMTESRSVIVCFDTRSQQTVPVPDAWREAMTR